MKLLFDQNISSRILRTIETHFPTATQVRLEGLENYSDKELWEYARDNDFIILTFDSWTQATVNRFAALQHTKLQR